MQIANPEPILINITTNENLFPQTNVDLIDVPTCRICLMEMNKEDIFSPCECKGSNSYFHEECLVQWMKKSKQYKDSYMTYFSICEICRGRIFLLTKTRFRCITKEELKEELFEKHMCCTMTTIIFLFFAFVTLGVISYVSSLASTKAELVLYGVGISVTVAIIIITLIVYLCTYVLKSDVDILGIDRKRERTPSALYKPSTNERKITPQHTVLNLNNQANHNNTIDNLMPS